MNYLGNEENTIRNRVARDRGGMLIGIFKVELLSIENYFAYTVKDFFS